MDLNSLLKGALPSMAANMTSAGANVSRKGLPEGMAHLLPLLGSRFNPLLQPLMIVYHLLGSQLGLDPTAILTLFGFFWAANKIWRQIYANIFSLVQQYLTSSIHISGNDEIYAHLMKWLAEQPAMYNSRSLMAETDRKTAWEDEDESHVLKTRISADGAGVYLNFSNQKAKAPPRFIPAMGIHKFWHGGTYFRLHRKKETFLDDAQGGQSQTLKDKEYLVISCYGWSPDPIKRLLRHVKVHYYKDVYARTTVRRPAPQNVRRYNGRHTWIQVADRPVRPMSTVVLDAKQKVQLLADINEYLHPATPRWYANRGIPLRRGYLFHGPPGTGKTSLSFALAGIFGLDIYVISLLDPGITEEDISALFNSLPRRCVVLLEDIDTAGLSRADEANPDEPKALNKRSEASPSSWKVSDLARALKTESGRDGEKRGISLSGLLNAIDGVASHEGRVLIMTTNHPESLDDALIRPGRVDLQVGFTNATKEQVTELFERMFEADQSRHMKLVPSSSSSSSSPAARTPKARGFPDGGADSRWDLSAANGRAVAPANGHAGPGGDNEPISATAELLAEEERLNIPAEELRQIAAEFAARIPDGVFSPAEIQGFLLKRKKNPRKAIDEVDSWVEAMLASKSSKTKVLQVQ